MIRKIYLFVIFFVLFLFPKESLAAEDSIRVSGFDGNRTFYILAGPNGTEPPGLTFPYMSRIYFALKNPSYFGPQGVVSCSISGLNNLVATVTTGSLVDSQGNLLIDVFFAPPTPTSLTNEEAEELAKFVISGGVLYVGGAGSQAANPPKGTEYNLLFEKLNIEDRFLEESTLLITGQSQEPIESVITRGALGDIGPIHITSFRKFSNSSLKGIIARDDTNGFVALEKKIGNGYLVVTGAPFFTNQAVVNDSDNLTYFLNLFALGCGEQDFGKYEKVVLDVPSFKQVDPVWENQIYDNGDSLDLWCDRNGNGASMAECACALSSASMVMKYHGVAKSPGGAFDQNPAYLNLFAREVFPDPNGGVKGFYDGNFNWYYPENFSSDAANFNNNKKVEVESRENFSVERVKQLIDENKPVIVKVTGPAGVHWVVVKGYEPSTNRLIINDPAKADPPVGVYSYLDENYTPFATSSMIVYKQTSSDFRRLQFATTSQNHLLVTDDFGNRTGFDAGQILKQIPNSDYVLDEYYGDATSTEVIPPSAEGVYFLTLKLPVDGDYKLHIFSQDGQAHPVQVYSSDEAGLLTGKTLQVPAHRSEYNFEYDQETAGNEINVTIDAQIDIVPFIKQNIIIPHRLTPVPVAVLASGDFDILKVDKNSLTFGKSGDENSLIGCQKTLVDVNRDHKKDMICYFRGDQTGLDTPDTIAYLKGKYEDLNFEASDTVKIFKPWFLFH